MGIVCSSLKISPPLNYGYFNLNCTVYMYIYHYLLVISFKVITCLQDEWTKVDQRIWHAVAVNQPSKLNAKLNKHEDVNVNKLCPSVGYSV